MFAHKNTCENHAHEVRNADAVEQQRSKQYDSQHHEEYPCRIRNGEEMCNVVKQVHIEHKDSAFRVEDKINTFIFYLEVKPDNFQIIWGFAYFAIPLQLIKLIGMLSILIPTYNYDCTQLVRELQKQAEHICIDYEIIVADDASPIMSYRDVNRKINIFPHCRLIELPENVGRARIRNRLADEAQGEWLLFMDSDAEVISDSFIEDYLKHTDADVVCGGLCHADVLPSPEVSLRYAYEKRADKKRAAWFRAKNPYGQFTPFNFMIRRGVFQEIRFEESIVEYGHEDTLFGIMLGNRNATIRHIDNPLRHVGLESNERFLEKTRSALHNLASLEDSMQEYSSLLKFYGMLRRLRIDGCISQWFVRREALLTNHLMSPTPSLPLFFAYKLGYYCSIKQ